MLYNHTFCHLHRLQIRIQDAVLYLSSPFPPPPLTPPSKRHRRLRYHQQRRRHSNMNMTTSSFLAYLVPLYRLLSTLLPSAPAHTLTCPLDVP